MVALIAYVILNNLPVSTENLYFEIHFPAETLNEIYFNTPILLKNLEICLSRCHKSDYEQSKNRTNISKLPFGTNIIYHLNTDKSLIKNYKKILKIKLCNNFIKVFQVSDLTFYKINIYFYKIPYVIKSLLVIFCYFTTKWNFNFI